MKVVSTYRILKSMAFDENIDERWIDWAIEMIEAGFESENLYMLAGESKPYNQFELYDLTDRVLKDLNLDYSDKDAVILNHVYYLISVSVDHPATCFRTLRELKDICIASDMESQYIDFYILYYAKDDLNEGEVQWYWDGANRGNINLIIQGKFRDWLTQQQHKTTAA